MELGLRNKVALVTGASRGIGQRHRDALPDAAAGSRHQRDLVPQSQFHCRSYPDDALFAGNFGLFGRAGNGLEMVSRRPGHQRVYARLRFLNVALSGWS